jgi:hypothetical protein
MGPIGLTMILTASLVAAPLATKPQQVERTYRVGWLDSIHGNAQALLVLASGNFVPRAGGFRS